MWWYFEILEKVTLDVITTGRCWSRWEWEAKMLASKQAKEIGGIAAYIRQANDDNNADDDYNEDFINEINNPLGF